MILKKSNYFFYLLAFSFFHTDIILSQDAEEFFSRTPPIYNSPDELLGWIDSRKYQNLNGERHYIVDPMNNGLPEESFFGGFPQNKLPSEGLELIEYDFESAKTIEIPGAWNAHEKNLLFYRGPVWFYKNFIHKSSNNNLTHLYIGASNFTTKVFLNGKIIASGSPSEIVKDSGAKSAYFGDEFKIN